MHLLALPGSLRAASINAAFCRAAARLAPDGIVVTVYEGLGGLPLFNPDLEPAPPAAVTDLRRRIGFVGKPVAVVNTSPRAHHAHEALLETLRTMSAAIVDDASIALPLLGSGCTTEAALCASPSLSVQIQSALQALADFARTAQRPARHSL